jgi:hypothetical protein
MSQTLACPHCGGSLNADGSQPYVTCGYCGNQAPVPDALRQAHLEQQTGQAVNRGVRYLIIFLVLVIGVPTCLGIVGSLFAAIVGIAAPIISILITFLIAGLSSAAP